MIPGHGQITRLTHQFGPPHLVDTMGWRTAQMALRYVHSNEDAKLKAFSSLGTHPKPGKVLIFEKQAL